MFIGHAVDIHSYKVALFSSLDSHMIVMFQFLCATLVSFCFDSRYNRKGNTVIPFSIVCALLRLDNTSQGHHSHVKYGICNIYFKLVSLIAR